MVGHDGEAPRRAGDGDYGRRGVVLDGGDLGRSRAQVSGRER